MYFVSDLISKWLCLSPLTRADILIAAPKTAQAVIAAIGDYYTWKLARKIYGNTSLEAWGAVRTTNRSRVFHILVLTVASLR